MPSTPSDLDASKSEDPSPIPAFQRWRNFSRAPVNFLNYGDPSVLFADDLSCLFLYHSDKSVSHTEFFVEIGKHSKF